LLHLVGCLYYLYQWCTVKQISDNEIYLLIKYMKSVLWRVAKRLSYIEDARCLMVKHREAQVINSCGISFIPCCVTQYCAFSNSFLSTFFLSFDLLSISFPLCFYFPYLSLFVFISPCWLLFSFFVSYLNSLCLAVY